MITGKDYLKTLRIQNETIYDNVEGMHSLECLLDDFLKENQAKHNEVLDLVMLTPDAIANHLEWDSYHHMMINEEHIDHQLKEAINMLFFTNKLEVPFG